MAPSAFSAGNALARLPRRLAPNFMRKQGSGRAAGAFSLAVRAAKDSDNFRSLVSEKLAEPVPAKREGWDGFPREVSNGEEEAQMPGEPAPWSVLNQIGVELDSDSSYTALVYGTSALVAVWISSIVVSALDSVPVVPQVMEVVGLGFTVWFTSRYLIFKENRDELITRIGSIKKQVLGSRDE
ncbi:protein CURVATURE THYLAKOID 1D, chloroplastic [Brachypodium distachyon]|uniref:Cyanobacterial aminoacyl-tRNA synthetase CAAD domain-containing protein n=1 Tax=Brachypodium distachyon TaxID=15368 RepID=I1IQV6_BRADI|nr:protein CURVATURE THYLAKOID 1D, chloroplastic [Brachypodium distachyon]KQJ90572.1 hypothetical protein BRADI_4g32540v3 [Brachypodium distachyon]|eukprot:XP_014758191.1 protein CURVATURE THYLAKOID 1D, chloroplastic [Brachypodium distachyon]